MLIHQGLLVRHRSMRRFECFWGCAGKSIGTSKLWEKLRLSFLQFPLIRETAGRDNLESVIHMSMLCSEQGGNATCLQYTVPPFIFF